MSAWKPGDVAVIEYFGESPMVAVRVAECPISGHGEPDHWHTERGTWGSETEKARPLVVIDPEDRAQVERLRDLWLDQLGHPPSPLSKGTRGNCLQAALREYVAPPKVTEPQGLGAVVEAIHDNHFVRVATCDEGWMRVEDRHPAPLCTWRDIAAVRVLSEGVTQ